MSQTSSEQLEDLKKWTEAISYGEVVRRALVFYERLAERSITIPDAEIADASQKRSIRIQVLLSGKTKDRLERFRKIDGVDSSYSGTIRTALGLYYLAVEAQRNNEELYVKELGKDRKIDLILPV